MAPDQIVELPSNYIGLLYTHILTYHMLFEVHSCKKEARAAAAAGSNNAINSKP